MVRQRRLGVIVMRHGEREDTADSQWVSKADRPWDPLLTARGKEEAARAGQAIIDMCNRYNLEPPSHVFSSPLTRCVQTARHAFSNLPTKIEPALWETLAQAWWLSWAAPGATGKWFAPQSTDNLCAADLHPAASLSLSVLVPTHYPGVEESDIDGHYKPATPVESLPYSWSHCESVEDDAWTGFEKDTACRLGRFVEKCEKELSGSTIVLVTHGGPSVACYHYLTGRPLEGGSRVVPPASFHIFVRETEDDSDLIAGFAATTKRRHTDTDTDTSDTDTETSGHTETETDTPKTPAPLGGPCVCAWGGWRALVTSYKDVEW